MKKISLILVGILLFSLTACCKDISSSTDEYSYPINSQNAELLENSLTIINTGKGHLPQEISQEDADSITAILNGYEFTENSPDCLFNYTINLGGRYLRYHFDCGTFSELVKNPSAVSAMPCCVTEKTVTLGDADRQAVNQIINKTLSLMVEGGEVISAKIIKLYEGSMLVATTEPNSTSDLITVPYDELSDFNEGDIVQILFDGYYNTTYPAQINNPEHISLIRRGNNLVSLYVDVITDIMAHDMALNEDIEMLVLDLDNAQNLTSSEKSAISYLLWSQMGIECSFSTYEKLVSEGQIKEGGHFDKGLLISVSNFEYAVCEPNFKFNLTKWRSPLAAYQFTDIVVTMGEDFKFNYEIGAHAIS